MTQVCTRCRKEYDIPEARVCPEDGATLRPVLDTYTGDEAELRGRVLDGRYLVDKLLGEGGMGLVLEAHHLFLDRPVAIKLLHPELLLVDEVKARFLREARTASAVRHPRVVEIMDFGVTPQGLHYLVMEYLEGADLYDWAYERSPLSARDVLRIGVQACEALAAIHAHGFVHRDLKPENLWLVDRDPGNLKLLDFGIAGVVLARGDDGQRERLTRTGRALGTPNYMSPEQARAVPIDGRADLYALGCVLWELATGEPAFPGSGPMEVMTRQLQEMPDPPSAVADGLPAWFDELLLKSLQKAPDDRYEDAEAMGAALAAGLERLDSEGGAPPAMEPAGPADSTSIPPARRPGSPRATQEQPVTGGEDPGPEGSPAPPPERSRKPWALAAAASVLLAAAVGAFAVLDGPGGDDAPGEAAQEGAVVSTVEEPAPPHGDPSPQRGATPPETGEADVPAGGDAAAEDAGPVSHESVVLELRVEPRGTRVFRNDEVLGTTPLTLTVEASEEEVDYRFEHPGREPATLSIRHDRARTIERTLETVAEAPTRPTAERRRPAQVEAEPEAPESGRSELMRPALPMDEEGP